MSDKVNALSDASLASSKQEPLTVREKIVNVFQELEGTRDEQRSVNAELDTEIHARKEAETEANRLRRQVQLAEVNLDNTTAKVDHLTTQLIEVIKVSETARHLCADLGNKLTAVKDKEIDLDERVRKVKENSLDTDKRFQEAADKLTKLQDRIEHAERKSIIAEKRQIMLEQDIRQAHNGVKSLMQIKEKAHSKEEEYQKRIEELQSRLKSAQQRTDDAEADAGKLQSKADQLKEKLDDERKKCQYMEKTINNNKSAS